MENAPHLLLEDRPDFERVLDEALRSAHARPDLAAIGLRLNAEQLRTMALSAATAIAACATAEYQYYVRLRQDMRHPATRRSSAGTGSGGTEVAVMSDAADASDAAGGDGGGPGGGGAGGFTSAMGEGLTEATGAGLVAMVSVLAPVLAGTAAVIFLLLGYAMHVLSPEPAAAAPMRTVGWVFAALAVIGTVVAMVSLWLIAWRNGASSIRAHRRGAEEAAEEDSVAAGVAAARADWRDALLERGILPFLREALDHPLGPGQAPTAYVPGSEAWSAAAGTYERTGGAYEAYDTYEPEGRAEQRTPRLGYSHPQFSSRSPSGEPAGAAGEEQRSVRPRFSSPDFSSPEYGGPEHQPE